MEHDKKNSTATCPEGCKCGLGLTMDMMRNAMEEFKRTGAPVRLPACDKNGQPAYVSFQVPPPVQPSPSVCKIL